MGSRFVGGCCGFVWFVLVVDKITATIVQTLGFNMTRAKGDIALAKVDIRASSEEASIFFHFLCLRDLQ